MTSEALIVEEFPLEAPPSEATSPRAGKDLIVATRVFQKEERWRSWWHLGGGLVLLSSSMAGAMVTPWWSARIASAVLAALMMLKLFIVYHDYMHRALLKRSTLAKIAMHTFGYFILAPPAIWKRTHDFHHANNVKLASSQVGSFPTISTSMYERLPANRQRGYRIARSPLVIIFGLITVFAFGMCVSPLLKKPRENRDAAYALVFYVALGAAIIHWLGPTAYLMGVIVPHAIAAMVGSYLFYAQHNYPGIQIRSRHDWEYTHAALASSSYCHMGPVLQWFSGNIGYHHVHHLNSAIPFYNLPRAMDAVPELQNPVATSLHPRDIADCLALKLWDPRQGRMVGFPDTPGSKPRAVEEPIDIYWHRPLASVIANALVPTRVTPNHVTLVAGLFGLISGVALVLAIDGHALFASLAGACLLVAAVLDCADGQLARLKNMSSMMGRALDGIMDAVGPTAVFSAMVAFLIWRGAPAPWVVGAGFVTALSLLWHAMQYDAAKNVYLHVTEPELNLGGDTLLAPEDMAAVRARLRAEGRGAAALVMLVWQLWTRGQMRYLRRWLRAEHSPRDSAERARYAELVLPVMRVTTWLGFGFHVTILGVSMLLTPFWPNAIWAGWLLIVGPLNLVAAYTAVTRRRRERRFADELARHRAPA